jgi:hypothetical protein
VPGSPTVPGPGRTVSSWRLRRGRPR